MPLFEIPKRNNGKDSDKKLVAKTSKPKTSSPSIKGGNSLYARIAEIEKRVELALGKFKERYDIITDKDVLIDYIDKAIANRYISIDTETDGLDPLQNYLAGICTYTQNAKGVYIPLNHISYITYNRIEEQLDTSFAINQFKRLSDAGNIDIDMFNAKFDIRFLRANGWKEAYCTWDGYLASRLLNENEEHKNLKKLHEKYVLEGREDAFRFDDLFKGIPFTYIPIKTAYLYAAHDPEITYELCEYQRRYLREDSDREDMRKLYWVMENIEMPCIDAVANMEDNGISFDMEYQAQLSIKYHTLLENKLKEIYTEIDKYKDKIDEYNNGYHEEVVNHSGQGQSFDDVKTGRLIKNKPLDNPINISSPTQLSILFYNILKIGVIGKKTPRGTGEDILKKIDIPLAKLILDYRGIEKLLSTYIDKLPNCINPNDGRIHCNFNQYGADTGRMSSSDPNLQNIPSHNKDIRKMFTASPGYVLMSSDFSQQEPKCLAALCRKQGDSQMYETFMQGKDLYSEIASKAFNKPYEECREFNSDGTTNKAGKERRTQAKSILLGVLYGRGVNSIAEQLGCTTEKAQKIKDSVFKGFPAIQKFEQDSLNMAHEIGYVTTVCGRKRRLPALQLNEYEFKWKNGVAPDNDLLDFDTDEVEQDIPERTIRKYITRLHNVKYTQKYKVINEAFEEGIIITDNGGRIADATRQTVNARIQGSAADLTKLAMIELNRNKQLKELGFRLLIPVHDEIIAECPEENAKECSKLLAETMSKAAEKILEMPIKCDVEITRAWYGERLEV